MTPHLVLMDISLPFFNGYHWCREIRNVSKVPVIFISSASDNMNIVMAMDMGGDDFIAKPFDLSVLTAKVQAVLRRAYEFSGGQALLLEHRGANPQFERRLADLRWQAPGAYQERLSHTANADGAARQGHLPRDDDAAPLGERIASSTTTRSPSASRACAKSSRPLGWKISSSRAKARAISWAIERREEHRAAASGQIPEAAAFLCARAQADGRRRAVCGAMSRKRGGEPSVPARSRACSRARESIRRDSAPRR